MNKGTLRTVKGDATDPQTTAPKEIVMIVHICNDENIWGGGFVIALSNKWELPEQRYRAFCNGQPPYPKDNKPLLGKTCYAKIDEHLIIANMIAQKGISSIENSIPIKYRALANCMEQVSDYIEMIRCQTSNPVVIHAPKFGSLRAGGDWNFILELIREIWIEQGISVVIYEFEE